MRVYDIKTKKHMINPNLTCEKQTNKETVTRGLKHVKEGKNMGIIPEISKENKAKI